MIKVEDKFEKNPKEMVDIELLETYSHYNRMGHRLKGQQDYIGLLRQEMLKRMGKGSK